MIPKLSNLAAILRHRRHIRFSMRTLLVAITCLGVLFGLACCWWTRPYVLTGTYPNGVRAWEQWEHRTMTFKLDHIKTVRYYQNGQLAFEFVDGKKRYWSPRGKSISESQSYQYFTEFYDAAPDQSKRPYQAWLWWWNNW